MASGTGRVGRYVRMTAQPGQGDALAAVLLRVAEGMARSPGCEHYVVNASIDEPDVVWVSEVWADQDASDRALAGEPGEIGIGELVELLTGPPEVVDLRPLGGAGL